MRLSLHLLWTLILVPAANAAEVYLADGSVIVGDILELAYGEDLTVDTEHMDEVVIEWEAVSEIHNTQIVDIITYDGRRYIGPMDYQEGELVVAGQTSTRLSVEEVFSIEEYNESFKESLSAHTDLGMNIVRGNNTVTQLSFGAGVGYDSENFETSLDGTTIINEQTDAEDTRRATLAADYTHKLGSLWTATALYSFESDEQQNLEGRSLIGAAIGRSVFNSRTQRLELFAGLAENIEKFEGQSSENSMEGIIASRYRLRSVADLDAAITYFPNLDESSRYRVQFDASLSFDLFSDFDFKTTVYDRYDSSPPAGNENNDYGITVGLSWSY
jgi:putative salt-induced outer membrane protein YdiY